MDSFFSKFFGLPPQNQQRQQQRQEQEQQKQKARLQREQKREPPVTPITVTVVSPSTSLLESPLMPCDDVMDIRDKRPRSMTPALIASPDENEIEGRPCKRLRTVLAPTPKVSPLLALPEDIIAHCLSFVSDVSDRHSLQLTCKQFQRVSNSDKMRENIQVGGDKKTGLHGIIQEHDTPETATEALIPFAEANNLEAIYMLGIIKSYSHQDVEGGVALLKDASAAGYVRASYALGLVLRESHVEEAAEYMKAAASAGYIPALQECLPPREMKAKYGEPNADELRRHLDPLCLNRLLSRFYLKNAELRDLNTSHCWNPLCGRWAFKATGPTNAPPPVTSAAARVRRTLRLYSSDSSKDRSVARPPPPEIRVSRMKMCSRCCRAKYCSKLCQVYDWRSGRHKIECHFL